MSRRFAIVLAALSLGGCMSTAPGPSGNHVAGAAGEATHPSAVGMPAMAETSLVIGANGTILACSNGGFTKPSPLWASTDSGGTFRAMNTGETSVGGDCDVAIGGDAWYEVYTVGDAHVNDSMIPAAPFFTLAQPTGLRLATSRDEGKTWQITTPVTGANLQDRPWLVANGTTIDLTYTPVRPRGSDCRILLCESADSVVFVRSADRGRTWSQPTTAYSSTAPVDITTGHPIESADGRQIGIAMEVIQSTNDASRTANYAFSDDGGSSWSSSVVNAGPTVFNLFPSAAIAPNGIIAMGFATGSSSSATVDVSTSNDRGRTWSDPIVLSSNASFDPKVSNVNMFASIAVASDDAGTMTVAWMEAASVARTVRWTVHIVHFPRGAQTASPDATIDAGQGPGVFEFLEARTLSGGPSLILYPAYRAGCGQETDGRADQCAELVSYDTTT